MSEWAAGASVEQGAAEGLSKEDFIQLLQQRAAMYGFLGRLYRSEIDEEFLQQMHDNLYPVDNGDEDLDQGYLYIATYLSNLWSESLKELSVDFSNCFFGHGVDAYTAAYPYESVYTSSKRLTMQGAHDEVLKIFRKNGIEKKKEWKEGVDHISIELEFEQLLCTRAIEALQSDDGKGVLKQLQTSQDFLKEHLVSWTPMMTADLKRVANTKMYQGLAFLTDGFLRTDKEFMDSLMDELPAALGIENTR